MKTTTVSAHKRKGKPVQKHTRSVDDASSKPGAGKELDSMKSSLNGKWLQTEGGSASGGVPGANTDVNGDDLDAQQVFDNNYDNGSDPRTSLSVVMDDGSDGAGIQRRTPDDKPKKVKNASKTK